MHAPTTYPEYRTAGLQSSGERSNTTANCISKMLRHQPPKQLATYDQTLPGLQEDV
jgi:hypothetical protein